MASVWLCDPVMVPKWAHEAWEKERILERLLVDDSIERDFWFNRSMWRLVEPDESGCSGWSGSLDGDGYAVMLLPKRATGRRIRMKVHRVRWMAAGHVIGFGFVLDHLCRDTVCSTVEHLDPVSSEENLRRGRVLTDILTGWRGSFEAVQNVLLVAARRTTGMSWAEFLALHPDRGMSDLVDTIGGRDAAVRELAERLDPVTLLEAASGRGYAAGLSARALGVWWEMREGPAPERKVRLSKWAAADVLEGLVRWLNRPPDEYHDDVQNHYVEWRLRQSNLLLYPNYQTVKRQFGTFKGGVAAAREAF